MIPLRDENPTERFAFVVLIIIILNVLVFIYELSLGEELIKKIYTLGVVPYRFFREFNLGNFLTLFTSLFLHGGLGHLVGNMLYLWIFGNNIEDRIGHFRFIVFYLLCGITASLIQSLFSFNSKLPMIGASGAISGVLGAYLILYPRARVLVLVPLFYMWRTIKVEAVWFLVFWIILRILYGGGTFFLAGVEAQGGVAWFAHIGGFFSGILFLKSFLKKNKRNYFYV
ncbi:MAG: rhomboid family intramembrane serine protease [Candidatus Omnitrophica bacterium]|nr:rhomboid family intramembrane serine protease [Candidatus Omnitrophota bacterium]